jgi:hypothetical protein
MADEQPNLMEMVTALIEGLRADFTKSCEAMSAKYDALAGEIKKRDAAGERSGENEDDLGRTGAVRTAADAVDLQAANSALASLARTVDGIKKKIERPMADLNAYAEAQAKADSVMRALGSSAEPPMSGEDLVAFQIRLARKMQPRSKTWGKVDLNLIKADQKAFNIVLDGIHEEARADALSTEGMAPLVHREITKTTPGGHKITEFVGNGTFIKQMSRPVRFVSGFRQPTPN